MRILHVNHIGDDSWVTPASRRWHLNLTGRWRTVGRQLGELSGTRRFSRQTRYRPTTPWMKWTQQRKKKNKTQNKVPLPFQTHTRSPQEDCARVGVWCSLRVPQCVTCCCSVVACWFGEGTKFLSLLKCTAGNRHEEEKTWLIFSLSIRSDLMLGNFTHLSPLVEGTLLELINFRH